MNIENKIINDIMEIVNKSQKNNMLTIRDVSRLTTLSDATIRRAVKRGKLKKCNRPGKLLFRLSDVNRWLGVN